MPKKYSLGLIDAPYQYDNQQQNDPKRGGITYPTLTVKQLSEIPIGNAFEDNSILVCWTTFPKICDKYYDMDVMEMIRSWNFRPVTALFVWVKTNKNSGFYSGLGRYTNSNAEIAIVARRGKGLPRLTKNVKQLIIAPIGKHSEKPREQYNRLDMLYGNIPRVELFARDSNAPPEGWDAVGLEYTPAQDIRDWIKHYDI